MLYTKLIILSIINLTTTGIILRPHQNINNMVKLIFLVLTPFVIWGFNMLVGTWSPTM